MKQTQPPGRWIGGLAALTVACQLLALPPIRLTQPTASPTTAPAPPASPAPDTFPPTTTPLPLLPTLTIPPGADAPFESGLLPAFAADADLGGGLTRYWIDVTIAFEPGSLQATLDGQARIRFVVPDGKPIEDLPLMLWPNDPQYHSTMLAGTALINGIRLEGRPAEEGVALWFRLPSPAPPGSVLDISLPFQITGAAPSAGRSRGDSGSRRGC